MSCGDGDGTASTVKVTTTEAGNNGGTGQSTVTTATGSTSDPALIGRWYGETLDETIEFTADGQMIWGAEDEEPTIITYTTENGTIVISIEATEGTGRLPYSIQGDVLTLEDPEMGPLTYTRVK